MKVYRCQDKSELRHVILDHPDTPLDWADVNAAFSCHEIVDLLFELRKLLADEKLNSLSND